MARKDLSTQIQEILKDYSVEVTADMKAAVREVAKAGVKKVKANTKVFKGTGAYRKGWSSQVEEEAASAQGVIYNKSLPGLPHLLEFGHAKRNGGRTAGVVHIGTVEEEIEREFMTELERRLS